MRIGHGYDAHKLVQGRKLILGGVHIPHTTGLLGHSDADVLIHAVMDALLGAMALGDIGGIFPDTDHQFKNADSLLLLEEVIVIMQEKKYQIENIDCTIVAQQPKIKPYIKQMIENIARVCNVCADTINIKATTEEGLGFTGNLEGISAHSICLLTKVSKTTL